MSETLREKGTYLLLIRCLNDTKRKVGSLGLLTLHSNKTYIYVGSAFGPGGLLSRVRRHLSREKKKFWHIDYILDYENKCYVVYVIIIPKVKAEHEIAKDLLKIADGALKKFGSSDCECYTHMFFFSKKPEETLFLVKEYLEKRNYEYTILRPYHNISR